MPVGSLTARKVNVRIVAATHRDLHAAIAGGRFREDLYYRLSMVELNVPDLKDRRDDIVLLARHFIQKFNREFSKHIQGLTRRASIVLERYDWPGNVRELEHVIGRACMLAEGENIDVSDLPAALTQSNEPDTTNGAAASSLLDEQERRLVMEALRSANGNQSEAARKLGIGRDALRYKMKRYEISA
jgi:DNA-binding NtrC family response regulator